MLPPTPADIQTAFHTKLKLDWKTGVAAADWDSIAKKEHLDSLTVEMRKLEGTIREVYNEMIQLQQREQELRDLNGEPRSAWAAHPVQHALLGACCALSPLRWSVCVVQGPYADRHVQHVLWMTCSSQPVLIEGTPAAVLPPRADWHGMAVEWEQWEPEAVCSRCHRSNRCSTCLLMHQRTHMVLPRTCQAHLPCDMLTCSMHGPA